MRKRIKRALDCVIQLNKQQTLFTKQSGFRDNANETSFMVSYNLYKFNKPFSDCDLVKHCRLDCVRVICPGKKTKFTVYHCQD